MNEKGEIKDCNNYGKMQGKERVGGIVGRNNGSITNCMSAEEGSIQGEYLVGGIAGINENSNTITDCYNLASVTSTGGTAKDDNDTEAWGAFTGGITGYNSGTTTRSINQGEISGVRRVNAGIVGRNKRNSILLLQ